MKNTLFIGPYSQNDGWGMASRMNIKALATTRNNLTIRPIYMGNQYVNQLESIFLELERNRFDKYDMVIQNVLPHLLDYNAKLGKNIGMFELETSNLEHTSWPRYINLMDEIWVTSEAEAHALDASGVTIPTKVVNQSIDLAKFDKEYELLFQDDSFKFYFIGEFIQRKGIHELLIAYFSEFSKNENVSLIIKTTADKKDIENFIIQTKNGLGMYKYHNYYPEVKLLIDFVDDETLNKIHTSCDCFVMPSHGESVCIPALDALGFGNTPIVTDKTGMTEFVNNNNGWVFKAHQTTTTTVQRPLADLYTGFETWFQPDILDLRRCMREAFAGKPGIQVIKSDKGKKDIQKYSHENIGKRYSEIL